MKNTEKTMRKIKDSLAKREKVSHIAYKFCKIEMM